MEMAKISGGGADLGGKSAMFTLRWLSCIQMGISRRRQMYASGVFIFSGWRKMGGDWIKGKQGEASLEKEHFFFPLRLLLRRW